MCFINACVYSRNDGILVKKIMIDDNQNVGMVFLSNVNYREKKEVKWAVIFIVNHLNW